MADLEYRYEDGVATILLNRPHKRNAFTLQMIDDWAAALVDAKANPDVRVVVVRGEGAAFCAGVDLQALDDEGTTPLDRKRLLHERVQHVPRAADELDKPLIACISGAAVGAGLDMALACDLRFAARSARLGETYVHVGLVPGAGGCYFLPRIVGVAKALELFLTGDIIDADEALRIGLVNRIYDDGDLLAETYAVAERLAAGPPISTRLLKRAVYQSQSIDLRTSLDLISSHMAVVQSTDDSREALDAFLAKRSPVFKGK
jgi:enoyl-CoA hydratase/carnithine racemase